MARRKFSKEKVEAYDLQYEKNEIDLMDRDIDF